MTAFIASKGNASKIAPVDVGFVFAIHQEAVSLLDSVKKCKKTRGNGRTYYTGKIGDKSVAIILSGVGQNEAEESTHVLLDIFSPSLVFSAGYGGGLSARMRPLTKCVPQQVVRMADMQALDLTSPIPKKSQLAQNKLTLLTASEVIDLPVHKRELHSQTGFEVVDMETYAVADVCRVREVPFKAVRVIIDGVDERVPKDITKLLNCVDQSFLRITGTIFGTFIARPRVVLDLFSLKRRAFQAAELLSDLLIREM